jgi:hypothetical protein
MSWGPVLHTTHQLPVSLPTQQLACALGDVQAEDTQQSTAPRCKLHRQPQGVSMRCLLPMVHSWHQGHHNAM